MGGNYMNMLANIYMLYSPEEAMEVLQIYLRMEPQASHIGVWIDRLNNATVTKSLLDTGGSATPGVRGSSSRSRICKGLSIAVMFVLPKLLFWAAISFFTTSPTVTCPPCAMVQ